MVFDTDETYKIARAGLRVHKNVIFKPPYIDMCKHPQIDMNVWSVGSNPDRFDLEIDDQYISLITGGFQPYNLSLPTGNNYRLSFDDNDVLDFEFDVANPEGGYVYINALNVGAQRIVYHSTGGGKGHKRTLSFIVEDEIRDSAGEIVTDLTLAVGESVNLNFFGGFSPLIEWEDTTGGILNDVSLITGPFAQITAVSVGTTTLRARGFNGIWHNVSVTVNPAP